MSWKSGFYKGRRFAPTAAVLVAVLVAGVVLKAAQSSGAWQWQASGAGTEALNAVSWDGSRFVTTAESGTAFVSADGLAWTPAEQKANAPLGPVAWDGAALVESSTGPSPTKKLFSWKEAHLERLAGGQVVAVCVGGSPDHRIFLAVGEAGMVLASADGAHWSVEGLNAGDLRGAAWGGPAGDERFVVVGQAGAVLTSPDGRQWSGAQTTTRQDLNAVAWCGTRFVAVGAAGTVVCSEDGVRWQEEESPVTQWLNAIAWSGARAVAVGEYGTIIEAAVVPSVSSVSPSGGPLAGGTTVTITGTGFTGTTAVNFGANLGTAIVVNSDTQVTCKSPAGAAGPVDVTVTAPGGTSPVNANDKFTYYDVPTVTSITPNAGLTAGGTTVTIVGTNFGATSVTSVKFGSIAATTVTVSTPTTLTAVSPAQAAAVVDVTVTTPGGTSATSAADKYTYVAPQPVVLSLSPTSGPMAGGTTVTVTGVGLTGATAVAFGAVAGTGVHVLSDTSLTVVSPSHAAGAVDVKVTSAGGTSPVASGDQFTFLTPLPTVTGLSPSGGPATGGTTVTITGTNFASPATVKFGAVAATNPTVVSDTKMTAVSPAGTGIVDVTVTTTVGTSAVSTADKYSYVAAPAVTAIAPARGSTDGGTAVTVTGSGFLAGATVTIGGVACTNVTVAGPTSITAKTGAHAPGLVEVVVANADSQSGRLDSAYTYVYPPSILRVTKLQDPFRLKLDGANFASDCVIKINGVAVPETLYKGANLANAKGGDALKAMLPKGTSVNITITNVGDGVTSAAFPYTR